MTRDKLNALIDRVIGSKGILRVPSWWFKRLFNNTIDYLQGYIDSAIVDIDDYVSDISENPVQNKIIKAYVDKYCSPSIDTEDGGEYVYIDKSSYVEFTGEWYSSRPISMFNWSLYEARIQISNRFKEEGAIDRYSVKFTTPWAYSIKASCGATYEERKKLLPITTYLMTVENDLACFKSYDIDPSTVEIPEENPGYLSFAALRDGLTISFTNDLEYSIDGGEWTALPSGEKTPGINMGQCISFKGNLVPVEDKGIGTFTTSTFCHITGNAMSLLFGDDYEGKFSLEGYDYAFSKLFAGVYVYSVDKGILPATTLSKRCYSNTFASCYALTNTPDLPATALAEECYYATFYRCTSLKKPATFPATQLAPGCYHSTYSNTFVLPDCTNIDWNYAPGLQGLFAYTMVTDKDLRRILPINEEGLYYLPAMELTDECYAKMFQGTINLRTAPYLPATTLSKRCYWRMFYDSGVQNCPPLPGNSEYTIEPYAEMFYGANLKSIELLANGYIEKATQMFYGNANLALIKLPNADGVINSYQWLAYAGTNVENPTIQCKVEAQIDMAGSWNIEYVYD